MGLHPYCIVPADHPATGVGIDDEPVRTCRAGAIAAWASEHAAPPAASLDAARAHDAVIRRAMDEHTTPVPLRFGQWAASEAILEDRIREHAEQWSRLLAEFAGAVEMGLRFSPLDAPPLPATAPRPTSGRAYMEQLREREHAREAAARAQLELLAAVAAAAGGLALRTASGSAPDDPRALWVAHLVRRERVQEYRTIAERAGAGAAGYRTAVTGPWPPYSFVS